MSPRNVTLFPVANSTPAPFAFRRLALAEDADADQPPLGDLAQEVAADVARAVVERDHRHAFEHQRAQALLHLLDRLHVGDHRAELSPGDGRDQIDEKAFAGADIVGAHRFIGTTSKAPRSTAVRMAASATERSTLLSNGKPASRSLSSFSACSACSRVGCCAERRQHQLAVGRDTRAASPDRSRADREWCHRAAASAR